MSVSTKCLLACTDVSGVIGVEANPELIKTNAKVAGTFLTRCVRKTFTGFTWDVGVSPFSEAISCRRQGLLAFLRLRTTLLRIP